MLYVNDNSYAALLLGINIGPHKRMPMGELKKMCECMGFANVRTLLASGNVIFDAPARSTETLAPSWKRNSRRHSASKSALSSAR